MKITVVGAGAIGSLLGGVLAKTNHVTLIGRPAHVAKIRERGLRIEGQSSFVARVDARDSVQGIAPPELILLTVKSYDTQPALDAMRPMVGPQTLLLTAQNGLGNWERARLSYPQHTVLAASVTYGAFLQEPGLVQWNGTGQIAIGGAANEATYAQKLVRTFEQATLNAVFAPNMNGTLWLKAIINAAINPLTAIHRVPNGRLVEDAALRRQMRDACEEAARVAAAEGVTLPSSDPWAVVEDVARTTAANRSSMLQSVERGQRTEIDSITGAILAAAKEHKIPCPTNQQLYDKVKQIERRA